MTLNFELIEDDLVAYQLDYATRSGHVKNSRLGALFLTMLMGILALLASRYSLYLAGLLAYVGVLFAFSGALTRRQLTRTFKKVVERGDLKGLVGASEVTLLPNGVRSVGPMGESLYYWSAVEQLTETETHVYVRFSSAINIVIPKRAFSNARQGAQFLKMAEEYRQAATGKPIPTTQRGTWWTQGTQVVETQTLRH